ncbi:hypothetical protein K0U27_09520 [archaeon]|nr:hypothetical protein [archaeon]
MDEVDDGFNDRKVERSTDRQDKASVDYMLEIIVDNNILLGGIGIVVALSVYWYFFKIRVR